MCSKQKIRKVAWCLLLVALFSLIPTGTFKVLADGDIMPPFPYDELQQIGENNYVLFKVHGLDQIDYVECIIPNNTLHGNYSRLLPGLSFFHFVGWNLQINSIDYCFKNGQKVDYDVSGLENTTSSLVRIDDEDPNHSFWLEFVYCTSDVYGYSYDTNVDFKGVDIKLFKSQNFIIPPAATPTPTPELTPTPQPHYFPTVTDARYTVSTYYDSSKLLMMRFFSESENKYMIRYFTLFSERNRSNQLRCFPIVTSVSDSGGTIRVDVTNQIVGGYSPHWNMYTLEVDGITYFDSLNQIISSSVSLSNHNFSLNESISIGSDLYYFNYTPIGDYYFEDAVWGNINSDGSVDFDGSGPDTPIATPTPTSAPTPIPQPSITPAPDDPDETSSWGWGIVNALKYIFIPDKNKLIRLEKTTQTRFQQFGGGYDDLKRVSGFEDPVRPQNIVINWTPFNSDSDEQPQQQQITLVDFEQIDFYLDQTSSGMFIKDCLSASFTFLMFGYLIHVIRKHFVIENNTSDGSDEGGD